MRRHGQRQLLRRNARPVVAHAHELPPAVLDGDFDPPGPRVPRRRSDDEVPTQTEYHLPLEVLYTIAPLIIVAVFFFHSVQTQDKVQKVIENPDHEVVVVGEKWAWTFNYVDEPSVGLAPLLVARTIDAIKELKDQHQLTVLMAEQNFTQAIRIADRGYVIVHGKIAVEGRSAEELNNNELIKKFYLGL